jgi:hypothetical protein
MYDRGLPENGGVVLDALEELLTECEAILAGGTAAALQMGHRLSVDLDFFTNHHLNNERIWAYLNRRGLSYKLMSEGAGFVIAEVERIKWSLFEYPYPFLDDALTLHGVKVAGLLDVASMKVIAISQRGTRRDFVDLFFILQRAPFHAVARHMVEQFGAGRINPVHIGKSLVYFTDAESDPEPRYLPGKKVEWKTIKSFFQDHVKQLVLDLDAALRSADPQAER